MAGQPAETFWDQTPRTHAAIMQGCKQRIEMQMQRDTALAWRIANFSVGAQNNKLKSLQHYLDEFKPVKEADATIEAVATFTALAQRGLVTIKERPKKGEANGG